MKIAFTAIALMLVGALLPLWMIIVVSLIVAIAAMFFVGRSNRVSA